MCAARWIRRAALSTIPPQSAFLRPMKLSRQKFADRFGLDARAVQEWEQGRRIPDRAARHANRHRSDPEAVGVRSTSDRRFVVLSDEVLNMKERVGIVL